MHKTGPFPGFWGPFSVFVLIEAACFSMYVDELSLASHFARSKRKGGARVLCWGLRQRAEVDVPQLYLTQHISLIYNTG